MSLRFRLAFSLALLAAFAALTVAITGYQATADRLDSELRDSLSGTGKRLSDPDGVYASQLCAAVSGFNEGRETLPRGGTDAGSNLANDLPGATVQCLTSAGTSIVAADDDGRPELPIDQTDRDLASGSKAPAVRIRSTQTDDGKDIMLMTVATPRGGAVQVARSIEENERVLRSLRIRYLILVGSVTAAAAAVGWVIALRITRPVLALTDVAETIAADGRLDLDVPTTGRDEVGRLSRAFESMLDALRHSRDQQQRLVQDAGHELRTPLTSLRTNIDTLRRHPEIGGDQRDRLLGDLDTELRELTTLTNELVGLAGDAGVNDPEEYFDLADLAQRSVDRAGRRNDHTFEVTRSPAPMVGQPGQLQRLIDNLLENAAKFSPDGTVIEVAVEPGRLVVRDHGPGISPKDLPHVFERFYRSTEARSAPGSGLGLSIVEDIARRHHGQVVASNDDGGGAVFTATFEVSG